MMGSMEGMGMDMGSVGMFFNTDSALARTFWYIIAGVVFLALLLNGVRACDVWWRSVNPFCSCSSASLTLESVHPLTLYPRKRLSRTKSITNPTRPRNPLSQCYATATAIVREATYPQPISFTGRWFAWLSPPPLGRLLLLFSYWAMIIGILTWKSIVHDAYYWERVGFRAAWVSVTQVPLVYLLVSKTLGLISALSYERLNWLHRWVARTLLITVTLHGAFFLSEWARADFVATELKMMPMVRYGLGAWGVLVWTLISSCAPFRNMAYELFVLQHLASAGIFLWLVYRHVPSYAVYNVWFAVGIVAFDRTALFCWSVYRNVVIRRRTVPSSSRWLGYRAELQAVKGDITMVTLRDVAFKWKVGQHIYLRLPKMGILESHPFTISGVPSKPSSSDSNEVRLIVRAHSGFTRRLHRRAQSSLQGDPVIMTALIAGPFGAPPAWNAFETLVLIAASTGASFTLPILESVIEDPCCVQSIDFLLLVKQREHSNYYAERLRSAISRAAAKGIRLRVEIAVTCEQTSCSCSDIGSDASRKETNRCRCKATFSAPTAALADDPSGGPIPSPPRSLSSDIKLVGEVTDKKSSSGPSSQTSQVQSFRTESPRLDIEYTYGRPNITSTIRLPVEAAAGETSVVVCGGRELVAAVRNYVAALSDARAVHKGSGAQGIHLHVEGYCF